MTAVYIHVVSWIAQFFSHAFAEKRAPALLDNLIGGKDQSSSSPLPWGFPSIPRTCADRSCASVPFCLGCLAVVLAPFFVHLEILFKLGYKPELHHEIKRQIDIEISKIRKQDKSKQ